MPVVVVLSVGGGLVYAYSQIELPKTLPPIQEREIHSLDMEGLISRLQA